MGNITNNLEDLKSTDRSKRLHACMALQQMFSLTDETISALIEATKDEDALVSIEAKKALQIHKPGWELLSPTTNKNSSNSSDENDFSDFIPLISVVGVLFLLIALGGVLSNPSGISEAFEAFGGTTAILRVVLIALMVIIYMVGISRKKTDSSSSVSSRRVAALTVVVLEIVLCSALAWTIDIETENLFWVVLLGVPLLFYLGPMIGAFVIGLLEPLFGKQNEDK